MLRYTFEFRLHPSPPHPPLLTLSVYGATWEDAYRVAEAEGRVRYGDALYVLLDSWKGDANTRPPR